MVIGLVLLGRITLSGSFPIRDMIRVRGCIGSPNLLVSYSSQQEGSAIWWNFFWAARILGENPHPLTNVGLVSIGAIAPATPTSQPTPLYYYYLIYQSKLSYEREKGEKKKGKRRRRPGSSITILTRDIDGFLRSERRRHRLLSPYMYRRIWVSCGWKISCFFLPSFLSFYSRWTSIISSRSFFLIVPPYFCVLLPSATGKQWLHTAASSSTSCFALRLHLPATSIRLHRCLSVLLFFPFSFFPLFLLLFLHAKRRITTQCPRVNKRAFLAARCWSAQRETQPHWINPVCHWMKIVVNLHCSSNARI